jgi:hypothetical protein
MEDRRPRGVVLAQKGEFGKELIVDETGENLAS